MTLKFDGWPKKTIGHIFYTMSSFVNHFKSIAEFKLELQSGNAQFRSILAIFFPVWPWNLMDNIGKQQGTSSILHQALCIISNPSVKSNLSYTPETLNSGKIGDFFVPCGLEIWWMTLKNNRAPDLYYIKLFASFQSHRLIQAGVTVRKRLNRVEIGNFLSRVNLKFERWPWKTIGHLSWLGCYKLCVSFHSHWLV